MKKRFVSVFLLLLMLVAMFAPGKMFAAEKLKLSKAKATMEVDSKLTLKLGDITATDVQWKSSARKVATVSAKGVITAVGEGTATITATYNKKKYTCKVTVVDSNKKENKIETYIKEEFGAVPYKETDEDGIVTEVYAKGKTMIFSMTFDESFDFGVPLTGEEIKEALQESMDEIFGMLEGTLQLLLDELQQKAYEDAKLVFRIYAADKTLIYEKTLK